MEKKINHESPVPFYYQLKEILKENIIAGEWVPGDKIPSENELRFTYQISRNTVKKALDDMVQEGLLNRVQGKGTFVSKPKLEQSLTGFYSFSKVIKQQGMVPKDIVISIEETDANATVANQLHIEPDEQVIALRRLRCADDEPIILETSYIPKKLIGAIPQDMLKHYSLYDYMEKEAGIVVVSAKEIFEPVLIRDYESHYLEVKRGVPCIAA
ncbi:GntR family transcriptional regulator [Virgibacillus halophilus]|uniref:GntR family transcriptional regulator n=1 Tax=Tigheibacillus halophilus TaxID=361280 RepID=A0ABU5C3S6_9BACI|nr:GntR family transcriptional regulator [Virgibacillus halophilus]